MVFPYLLLFRWTVTRVVMISLHILRRLMSMIGNLLMWPFPSMYCKHLCQSFLGIQRYLHCKLCRKVKLLESEDADRLFVLGFLALNAVGGLYSAGAAKSAALDCVCFEEENAVTYFSSSILEKIDLGFEHENLHTNLEHLNDYFVAECQHLSCQVTFLVRDFWYPESPFQFYSYCELVSKHSSSSERPLAQIAQNVTVVRSKFAHEKSQTRTFKVPLPSVWVVVAYWSSVAAFTPWFTDTSTNISVGELFMHVPDQIGAKTILLNMSGSGHVSMAPLCEMHDVDRRAKTKRLNRVWCRPQLGAPQNSTSRGSLIWDSWENVYGSASVSCWGKIWSLIPKFTCFVPTLFLLRAIAPISFL